MRPSTLIAGVALFAGCSDAPDDERVGLDVARLTPTLACAPIAGATVLGASPEGDLWLAIGAETRVLGVDGSDTTRPWRFDDAAAVQPHSATAASALIDGELWTVEDGQREFVATPTTTGAAAAWCGPPTADHGAFVATAGGLIERSAGLWWQWSPSRRPSFGGTRGLARIDGACTAADDAVWMTNDAGELWRITRDDADVVAGAAVALTEVAVVPGSGAAVLAAGALSIGPPWHDVTFDLGPVAQIASGGGRLWAVAGGATFVRTADGWAAVDGLPATPTKLRPDAVGGAWLEFPDQVCHAALTPAIRVAGLDPYARVTTALAQLRIVPPVGESMVAVERDGAAIGTAPVVDGAATLSNVDLGDGGWHELTVRAGTTSRLLEYDLLQISERTWTADVKPVFDDYCGGTRCHGPSPSGNRVDLSTYDGWRSKASRIRERLLRGEMPPSGPRPDTATIDVVLDWIEGGMRP